MTFSPKFFVALELEARYNIEGFATLHNATRAFAAWCWFDPEGIAWASEHLSYQPEGNIVAKTFLPTMEGIREFAGLPQLTEKSQRPMSQPTPEDPLASPSIAIWLPWYFKRGGLSILTVPVLLFLAFGFFESIWAGIIYFLAFIRASGAVFGSIAALGVCSLAWIPSFAPATLYYSLLRNIPGVWLRRDVPTKSYAKFGVTVGMLILLAGVAEAIGKTNIYAIAWIADRNPCAAYKAGVTGSIPPKSDCLAPGPAQASPSAPNSAAKND